MNKVNRETIKRLVEFEDVTSLSIYLPTHRFPSSEHIQEDRIRFKNLLRDGEKALEVCGIDEGVIRQIMSELEENIYTNDTFWQHTTEGLAVFCSPAGAQYFHLPIECEERVYAGDTYDITVLLGIASLDMPYYILALATQYPVLYSGDIYDVEPVAIELPESPEAALNIDEMHANSKTDRAGGYPGAKAHGQGDSKQAGQEERLKFFRLIDEKIRSAKMIDTSRPFLLAGTDDEVSGYRDSSHLKTILEESLAGNYTTATTSDLHDRSWPLVRAACVDVAHVSEIERLQNLLGTGKASAGAEDFLSAAREGRIDTLLIGMLTETRDTVNDSEEATPKIVLREGDEARTDTLHVRAVFDQGGTVVAVQRDKLPGAVYEAALYRF